MTTIAGLIESLAANPHDSLTYLVLADALEDAGRFGLASLVRRTGFVGPVKKSDGYGGDGGEGDGEGGEGGEGDGEGGEGGEGGGPKKQTISEALSMKDGLHLLAVPGGWSPYVIVGWVTVEDLFLRVQNCRVIRRFGGQAQLTRLAKSGPQSDTQLLDMSEEEFVSVVQVSRAIPCDPEKWRKECPEPAKEMAHAD